MSRNRKPLSEQKAHLTKEEIARKEFAESLVKGKTDKLKCPKWIKNKLAKKIFNSTLTELLELGNISNLDCELLGMYAQSLCKYIEITEQLEIESLVVDKVATNRSIVKVKNPLLDIQRYYSDEVKKYANLCGISLDARLKVGQIKAEKKENQITDEFGDI